MIINGPTVGTPMPRTNYEQTDPSKADYLKGKDVLDKNIQDAKDAAGNAQTAADNAQDTADSALAKANKAQPALNFVPVQQGFTATGGNKISLAWQEAGNGRYGIAVKVDNSVVGTIIVDNTTFGGTLPIGNGGTGATTRTNALKNLNASAGTPTYSHLCYDSLPSTGLVTAPATTEEVLKKMPANSVVTYTHNTGQAAYLSDAPFNYGIVTLKKGVNDDFLEAEAMDIATGCRYEYRYHRSSNPHRNGWKRILTIQMATYDYGAVFPTNPVISQIYFYKG